MAIIDPGTRQQLRQRFAERLDGEVDLHLYTRPGTGRLILPTGYGCATCAEAQEMAEALTEAAPDKVKLTVTDVSAEPDGHEVPALTVSAPGSDARITFQGLMAGFEFAAVVDAVERVSRADPGLSEESAAALAGLTADVEVLVFVTPG
jgi:alkyl hydroperoxide reductase subunit AhpF